MRRVPYHQSVFDLLGIQPPASPQARDMIEACERLRGGRLPESVRQWYLLEGVVALREDQGEEGHLWFDFSNMDHPEPLTAVLRQFAGAGRDGAPPGATDRVCILVENQAVCSWFLQPDGGDDPPVVVDEHFDGSRVLRWVQVADRFSDFVFDWVADHYFRAWTPISERSSYSDLRLRPPREKPYLNGLWLYAPDAEALAPPHLDYLLENFAAESRQEVAPGMTQHRFHDEHGDIRVTTDDYGEAGGVSAWWLHAPSQEDLFRLAKKVWWGCRLPATLRHRTEVAGPVMDRLRRSTRTAST
jgi:hypothetical protein